MFSDLDMVFRNDSKSSKVRKSYEKIPQRVFSAEPRQSKRQPSLISKIFNEDLPKVLTKVIK